VPEIRANALKLLSGKYDCTQNGTTLNQNFKTYKRTGKFYLEEIARCKIVLNFRGGGWDTMRYWEVPAVGAFMISQKPQIVIPNNFEEGKHVAWCSDSLDDLIEKIDYYLSHESEREKIAAQAQEHLMKYHLNTSRAAFLLEKVNKVLLKNN
jgi:spore maturation protein CgeB